MRSLVMISLAILLGASCGGGGGSDYNPTPPTTPSPTPNPPVTGSTVVNIPVGAMNLGAGAFGGPVTVRAGSTVTWSNGDTLAHNVIADNSVFNSGVLGPGRNFNFTFTAQGTVPYHCSIHPTMRGSVTVQP